MRRTTVTSLLVAGWLASGCGLVTGSPAPEAAQDLVGRTFVSTSVVEGGDPRSLVDGPLVMSFRYPPGDEGRVDSTDVLVGWTSGCNDYSLLVEVTANRLEEHEDDPDGPEGTLIGCEPAMTEQEGWLIEFFTDSPRWELNDGDLTLGGNDVTIELEEASRHHG